jgi:hypothetical protein
MGGTAPICPFCGKHCAGGGVKDHVKAKHPEDYKQWISDGQKPYWMYRSGGREDNAPAS